MMVKQIKFGDLDNGTSHGGILLNNGDVICGCCGCLIPAKQFADKDSYELLETFNDWVDLTEAIIN